MHKHVWKHGYTIPHSGVDVEFCTHCPATRHWQGLTRIRPGCGHAWVKGETKCRACAAQLHLPGVEL